MSNSNVTLNTENDYEETAEAQVLAVYNAANDDIELTAEEQAQKLLVASKRERRYKNNIKKVVQVQVQGGSEQLYNDQKGNQLSFDLLDSIADFVLLKEQPDEPQYSANATASRGGRPRLSDEG
jgi:hypothetical protein